MVENKITTYVAYLDVLGFSELISRGDEFENIFDKYVTSIKKIIDIVDSSFTYTIFSDTIILYAKDDEESSLISMTRIVSCIQYTLLLSSNIPIRGAISHGKIIHYERDGGKDRIISGPPIVEAYRYEQFQDWIGIMLTPSVLRKNKNLDKLIEIDGHNCLFDKKNIERITKYRDLIFSIHEHRIEFKKNENDLENERYHGFAIIPHEINVTDPSHIKEDIEKLLLKVRELKFEADKPYIQKKYFNTEQYFRVLVKWADRLFTTKWKETFWEKGEDGIDSIPRSTDGVA